MQMNDLIQALVIVEVLSSLRPKRSEASKSTTFIFQKLLQKVFKSKKLCFLKMKETPILILFLSFNSAYAIDIDPDGKVIKDGIERYSIKDYNGALESFNEAEQNFKDDERVNFNQGTAYYKLNDFENAKKSFEKSSNSSDKNLKADSFFNLGNVYSRSGDKKNAIRSYMKALSEKPNMIEARKNIELLNKENEKEKKDDKNEEKNQNQPNEKQNKKNKNQDKDNNSNEDEKNSSKGNKGLTKEEAEKILEQMGKDKINRKKMDYNPKDRDEIFW